MLLSSQNLEIAGLDNRNNLNSLNLHLATTKLCSEFYSNNDILVERRNKSTYKMPGGMTNYTCHLCAEVVSNRHSSSFEFFVHRFLKDKRIQKNRTNAFAVRSIRKELNEKYLNQYNELVNSIDTESMIFYTYDLIRGYSFDTNKLYVEMFNPKISNSLSASTGNLIYTPYIKEYAIDDNGNLKNHGSSSFCYFQLNMTEDQAQKIYYRYSNHFAPNPPFAIATKLHYALRIGKVLEGKPRYFQIILKKAEFFIPLEKDIKYAQKKVIKITSMEENKFAEVIFDENMTYTKEGYPIQKIKSQKTY